MDGGIAPAPGPAPAGSTTPAPSWRISSFGASGLTAASIVLLLLYLTGRFLWQYNKDAAAAAAQSAAASSSTRPASSSPRPRRDGVALYLLPVFLHVGAEAAECAVCLAELRQGEAGRSLPRCGHGFHEECITTWLRVNSTCPLCRTAVASK